MSDDADITALLAAWRAGGPPDALFQVVFENLRRIAISQFRGERPDHTLQPTAVVNEAWLRLLGQRTDFKDRAHFFGLAAQAMRRILVDHARRRAAAKRPSSEQRVAIDEIDLPVAAADLLGLDAALERLAQISPRQARVVDLKFFAGMELEEIADALTVARPTVVRDWRMARAWLQRELAS